MRVLFISIESVISKNLGIMYLSSTLKENSHECRLVYSTQNFIKTIREYSPDLIAFSCYSAFYNSVLDTTKKIKKYFDIPIIVGGPHPTFNPEIIKEESIDMICRGEGEYAFLELLDAMGSGKDITRIKNLWVKKGNKIFKNGVRRLVENLDSLPFPDRELFKEKYCSTRTMNFITSRGCPYNCSFCFNHKMRKLYRNKGRYVRRRSIENVIAEIKQAKNIYHPSVIKFSDDTFILDKKWVRKFCVKYKKEIDIPFGIQTRLDLIDHETVACLKSAGCFMVDVGIETSNQNIRMGVLKKKITNKQIEDACLLLRKNKIKIITYNMLGIPGEGFDDAIETIRFNIKIRARAAFFNIFQPYKGLELTEYFVRMGYFNKDGDIYSRQDMCYRTFVPGENAITGLLGMGTVFVRFPFLFRFRGLFLRKWSEPTPPLIILSKLLSLYIFSRATGFGYRGFVGIGEMQRNVKKTIKYFYFILNLTNKRHPNPSTAHHEKNTNRA